MSLEIVFEKPIRILIPSQSTVKGQHMHIFFSTDVDVELVVEQTLPDCCNVIEARNDDIFLYCKATFPLVQKIFKMFLFSCKYFYLMCLKLAAVMYPPFYLHSDILWRATILQDLYCGAKVFWSITLFSPWYSCYFIHKMYICMSFYPHVPCLNVVLKNSVQYITFC
mgnify:CR=1 FL=1